MQNRVDGRFDVSPGNEQLLAELGLTGRTVLVGLGILGSREALRYLLYVFAHVVACFGGEVRLVLLRTDPEEVRLQYRL